MNKFILFAAIAVLAMPASVTRAYDMWTNAPKASCDFTYKYEGDALPTAKAYAHLGFYLVDPGNLGTNGVWLGTDGSDKYLVINDPAGNTAIYYTISNAPAWQPGKKGPFTVEMRVRLVKERYGASLLMSDGLDKHAFLMYTNSVKMYYTTYTNCTTYTFHTYRIANFSKNDLYDGQQNVVWRDGVLLGQTPGEDQSVFGSPKQLLLGDEVEGSSAPIQIWIDYLRWDLTGAYPL